MKQFKRNPPVISKYDDNTYYQYCELISKNNQHRFKDIHLKNKTVKLHALVGSNRCFVKMLDCYFGKLPPDPKVFYLRPLKECPRDDTKPWYINVPAGLNTLKNMLPKMSEAAGVDTRYTNHSLQATSASCLFTSNVPEKVIQEKTGHRSLTGLRAYERTTVEHEMNVTRILGSIASNVPCTVKLPVVDADQKENEAEVKKEDEEADRKKDLSALFSGQLSNCVLNFYQK